MRILDRHLFALAFSRWALVLLLGVFLIALGEFVGNMGQYLGVIAARRGLLLAEYFLLRFPEFLATWLPLSAPVAGLLTAAPMLREGTLIALAASGVAPRRIFASLLVLALGVGGLGFLLKDQIIPRLDPVAEEVSRRMAGKREAEVERPRAVGWRSGNYYWCAQESWPEEGEYRKLAVFGAQGAKVPSAMLLADRLAWRDGRWLLANVVLAQENLPLIRRTSCPVAELGLAIDDDREALAIRLKPDFQKTSDELVGAKAGRAWGLINLRIAFALLAPLCLLFALPGFIHLDSRAHPGLALAQAMLFTLIPLGAHGLLSRLLISVGPHTTWLSLAVAGALLVSGCWRWWTMRL